ncbi:hypothetical protein [Streptomyces sp. NPDC005498]|uniref:hypothetical protein n=1 Tax=Streptomyces sp. NPDC005498 TaxID=3364717 RepID=UPI0036AB8320
MLVELEEFKRSCRTLSEHRRICTGEPIFIPVAESWPSSVRSDAEFGALVSAAYKLWRESWKLDVGFLLGQRGADGPARYLDRLIYQLRTAQQHTDNDEARTRWGEWTRDACGGHPPVTDDDWAACGRELMAAVNAAIDCLCKLAGSGRRMESFRQEWRAKGEESTVGVVTRVASDLGMHLRGGQRAHHERQVERHWSRHRLRSGETAADVLAAFAECSLLSEMEALPCSYQWILDELRVLGTADAIPALRLAHAVAEISRTTGETYVKLVESTWVTLRLEVAR